MDVLIDVTPDEIGKYGLKKGSFNEHDATSFKRILKRLEHKRKRLVPGGSAANTVALFSSLGGKAAFIGKAGNDSVGNAYIDAMEQAGVKALFHRSHSMTGQGICFITPDSERTFAAHLGAALELSPGEIDSCAKSIHNARFLHLEGYLFDRKGIRDAAFRALEHAKHHGVTVSIDCADPGVILRNKDSFRKILHESADILFANEAEAKALTGHADPRKALRELARHVDIAIVKTGKNGSLIMRGKRIYTIKAHKVVAVDTTGAGDAYAGAFLYALSKGHSIPVAGELASFLAAKVVAQKGARLEKIPSYNHIIKKGHPIAHVKAHAEAHTIKKKR